MGTTPACRTQQGTAVGPFSTSLCTVKHGHLPRQASLCRSLCAATIPATIGALESSSSATRQPRHQPQLEQDKEWGGVAASIVLRPVSPASCKLHQSPPPHLSPLDDDCVGWQVHPPSQSGSGHQHLHKAHTARFAAAQALALAQSHLQHNRPAQTHPAWVRAADNHFRAPCQKGPCL
jgi:hypothetical protein